MSTSQAKEEDSSNVPLHVVHQGSHGDHWSAYFGFDRLRQDTSILLDHIDPIIQTTEARAVEDGYTVVHGQMGERMEVMVILDATGAAITTFPCLFSSLVTPVSSKALYEWGHVEATEAHMAGAGRDEFSLHLFLVDYLEQKKVYKQRERLSLSITGFAYSMQEATHLPESFTQDFVGYMPYEDGSDPCVYQYIGQVLHSEPYTYGLVTGSIVRTQLTRHEQEGRAFVVDLFIQSEHLRMNELTVGMRVSGLCWLQGRLAS